jgi:hypothetical protein
MRIASIAAGALMLMACNTVPPEGNGQAPDQSPDPVPVAGEGACDAAAARGLIGRQRSDAVGAEAMRLSGARTLRWLEPDAMYTQDFREDRLNIDVDSSGRITRFRCF